MNKSTFTIGAFAMVFDEQERILLAHRTDMDLWNLPGGGVEAGETPWEAVVREVEEETGLIVVVDRLSGVYVNKNNDTIVFHFLCHCTGGALTLNAEARDLQYFSVDEFPINTAPRHKHRIENYVKNPTKVYMEETTGMSARELLDQLGKK